MALNISSDAGKSRNPPAWLRWLVGITSLGTSEIEYSRRDREHNAYLEDLELLQSYETELNNIQAGIISNKNDAFYYEGLIEDLDRDKAKSEEWLEDYRQMLAGEGDDDNLLLQQDRINQQNVDNAERDLAAYKDSSALELDSLIRSGFSEYTSQRNDQAMANIYASASGSVVGSYNSAARRSRNAIRAFVGDDMKFNEASEGTSIQGRAGGEMIGSYAKMLLSSRTTVRNNIAKLNTSLATAKLAYDSFRDEAADVAEENEQFLEDYDKTRANYEMNLSWAYSNISSLQNSANKLLADKDSVLADVNKYEKANYKELTTWD